MNTVTKQIWSGKLLKYVSVEIPIIPDIAVQILEEVAKDVCTLNMVTYHNSCGSSHCIAGWAIVKAGLYEMEEDRELNPRNLGEAILKAAGYYPVSDWQYELYTGPNKIYVGASQQLGEESLQDAAIYYLDSIIGKEE